MPHKVDTLPIDKRTWVIDQLLRGSGPTMIAKHVGLSTTAIIHYRDQVVRPAHESTPPDIPVPKRASTIAGQSPVRSRLEELWGTVQHGLERAKDEDNLMALAQIINQGHKNVHILAQITGEIGEDQAAKGLTVQIVMPVQMDVHVQPAEPVLLDQQDVVGPVYEIGLTR